MKRPNINCNYFFDLAETFEYMCGVVGAQKKLNIDIALSDYDFLGEFFSKESLKQSRSEKGQFFTPHSIVSYLLENSNYSPTKTMADLSCGSGRFLIEVAKVLIRNKSNLVDIQKKISGFDIDPVLVRIATANLRGLLALHGYNVTLDTKFNIKERNSLEFSDDLFNSEKFDFILGNPPYIKASPKTNLGHPNLYASFVEIGINKLNEGGTLAYIIPKSFISGAYFSKLRDILMKSIDLKEIVTLVERDRSFEDVLQEQVLLTLVKNSPKNDDIVVGLAQTNGEFKISKFNSPREVIFWHENYIAMPTNKSDVNLIKKCFQNGFKKLANSGIRISTGPIVPFRSKDLLRTELTSDTIPLYWPHHITIKGFTPSNNKKKEIAIKNCPDIIKHKLNKPVIAIKRISSKEQNKRIEAAIISKKGEYTLENHLNYLIRESDDAPSLEVIESLLNSNLWDYLFRLINGNTQVSASELRLFPLPHDSKGLEMYMNDLNFEEKIHSFYGLSKDDSDNVLKALK